MDELSDSLTEFFFLSGEVFNNAAAAEPPDPEQELKKLAALSGVENNK